MDEKNEVNGELEDAELTNGEAVIEITIPDVETAQHFPVDKSKGADETEPDFNDVNNINDAETDSKPAVQFVKKKRHKKVSETHVHFSQSVMKKDDAGSSVVTIARSTVDEPDVSIKQLSAHIPTSRPNQDFKEKWKYSLIGSCFSKPYQVPFITLFCPVYTEYKLARITSNFQKAKTMLWMFVTFWLSAALICVVTFASFNDNLSGVIKYSLLSFFIFLMLFTALHRLLTVFRFRVTIRHFFAIKGSFLRDLIEVTFCRPCVLCQIMGELEKQRELRGSVGNFRISVHYEHAPKA